MHWAASSCSLHVHQKMLQLPAWTFDEFGNYERLLNGTCWYSMIAVEIIFIGDENAKAFYVKNVWKNTRNGYILGSNLGETYVVCRCSAVRLRADLQKKKENSDYIDNDVENGQSGADYQDQKL